MSEINVITPFSVDGTRYLPLGPELRGIGTSSFQKSGSELPRPSNNRNLEEEFLFGTSKYTKKWYDETNQCYREDIIFGLGKYENGSSASHKKCKYFIECYQYDTQPEEYDATTASRQGTDHLTLALDYHKKIYAAGTKVYKLYHVTENGSNTFVCKKTVTQEIDSNTGKCIIKQVISYTDN